MTTENNTKTYVDPPTRLLREDIFRDREYHLAETVLCTDVATLPHRHDFYEIFLVTSGKILHTKNGRESIMNRNSCAFIHPNDLHAFCRHSQEPARFVNLAFTGKILDTALRTIEIWTGDYGATSSPAYDHIGYRLPETTAQSLLLRIRYLMNHMTDSGDYCRLLPIGILVEFLSGIHSEPEGQPAPDWLISACDEMRIHREQYLFSDTNELVRLSQKSREHLTREMKKAYGITPSMFMNRLRLEYAAELLKTTDLSVTEILVQSGFGNVSYFHARFREMFGLSPREYRRQNRALIHPTHLT